MVTLICVQIIRILAHTHTHKHTHFTSYFERWTVWLLLLLPVVGAHNIFQTHTMCLKWWCLPNMTLDMTCGHNGLSSSAEIMVKLVNNDYTHLSHEHLLYTVPHYTVLSVLCIVSVIDICVCVHHCARTFFSKPY